MKFAPSLKALIPVATVGISLLPTQAHAFTGTWDAPETIPFNGSGSNSVGKLFPTGIFSAFNPTAVEAANPTHNQPTVTGFQFYFPTLTASGVARVICDDEQTTCPAAGPFDGTLEIKFKNLGTAPGVSGPAGLPIIIAGPATTSFTSKAITGSATNVFGPVISISGSSFTNPPTATLASSYFTHVFAATSPGIAFSFNSTGASQALFDGTVRVRYEYSYVPGPLPLLGAGAAFGWTRRLRKKISRFA